MKKNKLIIYGAGALLAYLLYKKFFANKPAAQQPTGAETLIKLKDTIIETMNDATDKMNIDILPSPPQFIETGNNILKEPTPTQLEAQWQPSPPQIDYTGTGEGVNLFNDTQSQLVKFMQVSPTPASVLSPEQFLTFKAKQLGAVCY